MHRRVWLLVAGLAALSLALGTGGFSAAELERGLTVNVVDDPADGHVGIEYLAAPATVEYGSNDGEGADPRGEVNLLTLRNNLGDPAWFTVRVSDPPAGPPMLGGPADSTFELGGQDGVASGERVHLEVPVVCAGNADRETWTLYITAEWDGVTGELTREATIECEKRTPPGPPENPGGPPAENGEEENEGANGNKDRGGGPKN